MAYLLLVADPVEKKWSVIMQSDEFDDALSTEIDEHDPSLRVVINTDNYITFSTKEGDNGSTSPSGT